MIVEYAPEGDKRRTWDLSKLKFMSPEAETVETLTDWTWAEAQQQLSKGSIRALRVFAYVLEKRDQPTLKWTRFTPAADELDYWLDDAERAALREQLEDNDELDDDERDAMLTALDQLDAVIAAKDNKPEPAEVEVPKASDGEASPTAG